MAHHTTKAFTSSVTAVDPPLRFSTIGLVQNCHIYISTLFLSISIYLLAIGLGTQAEHCCVHVMNPKEMQNRKGDKRLTLSPLSAVGVQVVGVKSLGFVQAIEHFTDVHYLMINKIYIKLRALSTSGQQKYFFLHLQCILLPSEQTLDFLKVC